MKYDSLISNLTAIRGYNTSITLGNSETAKAIYCVANELAELNRKLDILTNAIKNK